MAPARDLRPDRYQPTNLADLLERVLDKGVVIAGDITLSLGTVELLNLKIRLLIASIDKAQEIGINWWQSDPALSSRLEELTDERDQLKRRVSKLEALSARESDGVDQKHIPAADGVSRPAIGEQSRSASQSDGADREKKPAAARRPRATNQQARSTRQSGRAERENQPASARRTTRSTRRTR